MNHFLRVAASVIADIGGVVVVAILWPISPLATVAVALPVFAFGRAVLFLE